MLHNGRLPAHDWEELKSLGYTQEVGWKAVQVEAVLSASRISVLLLSEEATQFSTACPTSSPSEGPRSVPSLTEPSALRVYKDTCHWT